jgi:PEP-CTERM motif
LEDHHNAVAAAGWPGRKIMLRRIAIAVTVSVCVFGSVADAADIKWVEVDNSALLSGFRTFDLFIRTDEGWCCNAMLFELSKGTFFQDPFGDISAPNPAFFDLVPTLEFDTYLTENGMGVNILGSAGDVGGDVLAFSTTELDVSWNTRLRPSQTTGWIQSARITISEDAEGTWDLLIAESNLPASGFSGTVQDIVPEPGTLWLMAGVVFGLCLRRRDASRVQQLVRHPTPWLIRRSLAPFRMSAALVTAVSIFFISPSTGMAAVDLKWVEVDNTAELTGYRTFDLLISTDAPWANNSMLFVLDQGSFYQDPFGETAAPDPILFQLRPALEFDTYVTGLDPDLVIAGPALSVGGDSLEFGSVELDIAWTWTLQDVFSNQWHRTARVTFQEGAVGTWAVEVLGPPDGPSLFTGTVTDIVPEPGSLVLCLCGAMLLSRRGKNGLLARRTATTPIIRSDAHGD